MIISSDDNLARVHEEFRKNHEAGRERLLEMLRDEEFPSFATRRHSMRNVWRVLASRPLVGHLKTKLAVAAVLFAALTIGICLLWHSPQQAYALEDLPARLLEIKSIYMTGWLFPPEDMRQEDKNLAPKYPMTIFAERPNRFWHSQYGFSGPDVNRKSVRVWSGVAVGHDQQQLYLSTKDKVAHVLTVASIENELRTESLIQAEIPHGLLGGDLNEFARTGAEAIDGVLCDVYERSSMGFTRRLWLHPQTGLPARIALYQVDDTGREMPCKVFDHIDINVPASATGLSFDPPKDYRAEKTSQSQAASLLRATASGSNGEAELGVWHCFNIDEKAVLACWYCELRSDAENADATRQVEFCLERAGCGSSQPRPYGRIDIAAADDSGHHWHWSLVFPKKTGERIGNDILTIMHHPKNGGRLSMHDIPLRLSEDRLKGIMEEAQRLTKTTVSGSSAPFSLATLREQLANAH